MIVACWAAFISAAKVFGRQPEWMRHATREPFRFDPLLAIWISIYLCSICNQRCPKREITPLINDRSKACATSPAGYTIGEREDMLDEALVDGNGVPTDG
jgi:hypothetical protein